MTLRKKLLYLWLLFLSVSIIFVIFNPTVAKDIFEYLSTKSLVYLYGLILILGVLRGFTLIPVTYLIILGLLFVPALPLFIIILVGVVLSSISVYFFFEYLHIDKMIGEKYHKQIDTTKYYLTKYELPVIIFWSMNPLLPSDIICYVAGTLRINIYKFVLGMILGEGLTCAVYIFGGKYILGLFGLNI